MKKRLGVTQPAATVAERYGLGGSYHKTVFSGVNIVKMSNGSVKKEIVM